MDAPTTSDQRVSDSIRLVNALGTAWATFTLYPDPVNQPAFLRAVELLASLPRNAIVVGIGPGTFTAGDEELTDVRDGARRLARELFINDVEQVAVSGSCTSDGLVTFFSLLEANAATNSAERAEFVARLAAVAESGLMVDERNFLVEHDEISESDGGHESGNELSYSLDGVALEAYRGLPPEELATLVVGAGDDPDTAADLYATNFEELYEQLTPVAGQAQAVLGSLESADDPWKSVRNLIEAFFYLPHPVQVKVLETVLADTSTERNQVFLDQFSGLDLAEFIADLSDEATQALLEYAVASAGTAEGAPKELLANLQSAKEVQDARKSLSARVSELLQRAGATTRDGEREVFDAVREGLRTHPDPQELTVSVLRGLLECEVRDDRFKRILRLWTGRIAAAIRDSKFEEATDLMRAVLDDPPYSAGRDDLVKGAVRKLAGPELLRMLAEREDGSELSDDVKMILSVFGTSVIEEFVRQLAEEEDSGMRRTLIELLTVSVAGNPRSLEPHLTDTRWYVVRNLVMVLGRTGRQSATSPTRRMLKHDDHRVRIEAMRSLTKLLRGDAARFIVPMLADPNSRVRSNAAALLKASESDEIDQLLAKELDNDAIPADVADAIVELLAHRRQPAGIEILQSLAGRKLAVKSSQRVLRERAKKALKELT